MPEPAEAVQAGLLHDRYHTLTIADVIDETSDARSLVFAVPDALSETFRYRPGQFLTLRVAHPGGALARCYSLSSAPGIDRALDRKSTRLNSSHIQKSRMPSSA